MLPQTLPPTPPPKTHPPNKIEVEMLDCLKVHLMVSTIYRPADQTSFEFKCSLGCFRGQLHVIVLNWRMVGGIYVPLVPPGSYVIYTYAIYGFVHDNDWKLHTASMDCKEGQAQYKSVCPNMFQLYTGPYKVKNISLTFWVAVKSRQPLVEKCLPSRQNCMRKRYNLNAILHVWICTWHYSTIVFMIYM